MNNVIKNIPGTNDVAVDKELMEVLVGICEDVLNNSWNEKEVEESYSDYYESKECYMIDENEVKFFKDEDGYNLWIDFLRVHPTLEEAKEHRIGLLKEVTKLGFEFETKEDVEVKVEVDHIEDAELYSIILDIPVFENVEDAYSWIYKAIEVIHNLK